MVKLEIDNRNIDVPEQTTVLEAAERLGIEIPTMCHLAGYPNFTSCMVCMVEDKTEDRLLPACSTLVAEGMRIDTASPTVCENRKTALELLLSEHVGDCDAPCEIVCRAGINIPLMIRKIAEGDMDAAAEVVRQAVPRSSDPCGECNGRCEKACRRRRHDGAVAIQLLVRHALDQGQSSGETATEKQQTGKRFNCSMGKIRPAEMTTFLENASPSPRLEPAAGEEQGFNRQEAIEEARRCLHCDCRKRESCKLRRYATAYQGRQRHYAYAERKLFRQIRQGSGVVYEPGKCIKCGICVRITARQKEELGLAFVGRGFDVEVGVPFNQPLRDALTTTAAECVANCPTAALAFDMRKR